MHEVSELQSSGNAHYTSSLINHQGTETFCNLLLIDSPLMSPADAMSADCIITGWELQFHILAESFFTVISTWTHTVRVKPSPAQPVYCLFSPVCRHPHPNPGWSYHITQLCTRAPVSECSPQVMDSVSGMWDPLRWLFSAHALWRVIPFSLQFNLGTEARGAVGQRLYKQHLGVAVLSELLTEERPVWFLRVFHIFVS